MLSIMIPAYNERGNLEELTMRFIKTLLNTNLDYNFVYVIQGEDGCLENMRELKRKHNLKNMRIIYSKKPMGVGPAHIIGFKNVPEGSDYIVTMDGDLNHMPEGLPVFLKKLEETNADILVGSRKVQGSSIEDYTIIKIIMSRFVNTLLPILMGIKIRDITSGYRLAKIEVVRKIIPKIKSKNHEYYPEFLLLGKKYNYSMVEVPIDFKVRVRGKSKLIWIKSCLGYIKILFLALKIRFMKY